MRREGPSKLQGILDMLFERSEEFPLSVRERIYYRVGRHLDELLQLAEMCDSPIEFLLGERLEEELNSYNTFNKRVNFFYFLHPQIPIVINEQTYRVDFLIAPMSCEFDTNFPHLIIECDGHDFHEKTPEQATRDKQKDRALQLAGYKVIRFTGSEIYKNPRRCAREVINFLRQIERDFLSRSE